jgi:hypothetical protein
LDTENNFPSRSWSNTWKHKILSPERVYIGWRLNCKVRHRIVDTCCLAIPSGTFEEGHKGTRWSYPLGYTPLSWLPKLEWAGLDLGNPAADQVTHHKEHMKMKEAAASPMLVLWWKQVANPPMWYTSYNCIGARHNIYYGPPKDSGTAQENLKKCNQVKDGANRRGWIQKQSYTRALHDESWNMVYSSTIFWVKQLLHHMELIGAIQKTHATLHIVGHCKHAEASSMVLIIS